jgi:AcrR family transcriptional regulator
MLTDKGAATRGRIVAATADLILRRGVGGTSLDDIRLDTATSKSQLFHYFPGGKNDLILAIAAYQMERVLEAQRPHLDELNTWHSWQSWRDAVVTHYRSQPHWGCPIGSLTTELLGLHPDLGATLVAHLDRWHGYLDAGLHRMHDAALLHPNAEPDRLATHIFAALQGGLLLTQTARSIEPLEAALDGALDALRHHANPSADAA